ncbi:antibiotic biosynthesis monooxygenase [Nocardioides sp. InS609-2]|uniref:antibiotic biosynthesis monooxygenase n=1 Tax=Nocardioides sp. InS609-2 TaxID=2760705 RepID=UPI0020BEB012|nr:antibiotic biosynthesis monooxygenase [Nocardioides sp. InS609-2]
MTAIELARFTVRQQDIDTMLARRPAMADALRERIPGFIDLRLVRLDEHTWLDIVEWTDRPAAEVAQAAVMQVPECTAVFELIDQVVSMEHGAVAFHAGSAETVRA